MHLRESAPPRIVRAVPSARCEALCVEDTNRRLASLLWFICAGTNPPRILEPGSGAASRLTEASLRSILCHTHSKIEDMCWHYRRARIGSTSKQSVEEAQAAVARTGVLRSITIVSQHALHCQHTALSRVMARDPATSHCCQTWQERAGIVRPSKPRTQNKYREHCTRTETSTTSFASSKLAAIS